MEQPDLSGCLQESFYSAFTSEAVALGGLFFLIGRSLALSFCSHWLLVCYMLYRRRGSLNRELGVKTPYEAVEKWYALKPEIFSENPLQFLQKVLTLNHKAQTKQGRFPK